LIREKLIAGQADTSPPPETRDLSRLHPEVVNHTGVFEYTTDQSYTTTYLTKTWESQGSMGYGSVPVGDGSTPYRSFMSNKEMSTMAPDTYVGATDNHPTLTFGPLNHTGCGTTFAVGNAEHTIVVDSAVYHAYPAETFHGLITIHGLRADTDYVATAGDYDDASTNGSVTFYYDNRVSAEAPLAPPTGNKTHQLYVSVQDSSGVNFNQLSFSGVHFYAPYGRLMPVEFEILPDGTFLFRVDNTRIEGNISQLTNKAGNALQMPTSGDLYMTIRAMDTQPYITTQSGLIRPISRLTNVAVNDNDNSDNKNHVGKPPFVTGIPCTPVRSTETDWDLPLQVVAPQRGWIPYSESSPTVEYGLSAVADNQLFETRGVAASGTNKPLHVYTANKFTLTQLLTGRGLTNVDQIESINTMLFDSAVFGSNHLTVQLQKAGTYVDITDEFTFPGIQNDFNNSVVTFVEDINDQNMTLDTFDDGLVFTLTVSGSDS